MKSNPIVDQFFAKKEIPDAKLLLCSRVKGRGFGLPAGWFTTRLFFIFELFITLNQSLTSVPITPIR